MKIGRVLNLSVKSVVASIVKKEKLCVMVTIEVMCPHCECNKIRKRGKTMTSHATFVLTTKKHSTTVHLQRLEP